MSILRPNVLVSTARGTYTSATHQTSAGSAHLSKQPAQLAPLPASQYARLPADLQLKTIYKLVIDLDVDVLEGDTLTSVTELDGVTSWPRHLGSSANVGWRVRYIEEMSSYIRPRRICYVELARVGR